VWFQGGMGLFTNDNSFDDNDCYGICYHNTDVPFAEDRITNSSIHDIYLA